MTVKQVHEGYTALYYVYDYSNRVGSAISWKDSQAKAIIFGPNGSGQVRVYKQVVFSIAMAVITCHFEISIKNAQNMHFLEKYFPFGDSDILT